MSTPPLYGQAEPLYNGIRRIVANNPSPLTYFGTNTYIIGQTNFAVIDPGPMDKLHLAAILKSCADGVITHIFVTHSHLDHSPLARELSTQTNAPIYAFGDSSAGRSPIMTQIAKSGLAGGGEGIDPNFKPDMTLSDGEITMIDGIKLTAHWTPGHFGNHMSFNMQGIEFCGDLIMDWSSSLVSPPDGDLTHFMRSCRETLMRSPRVLLAGHGNPILEPAERIEWLLNHRISRETQILTALRMTPDTPKNLAKRIYTDVADHLLPAASRNVFAHLIDLTGRNKTEPQGPVGFDTVFQLLSK